MSANQRFLQHRDGTPFFWQGDTAWGIFRNSLPQATIDPSQPFPIRAYFEVRAQQGFNVLQTQLLPLTPRQDNTLLDELGAPLHSINALGVAAFDGVGEATRNFALPRILNGIDPANINDYWDYVAFVIDLAAEHGMYIAIVPAWNNHFNLTAGSDVSELDSVATDALVAYDYGRFLGLHFGSRPNVIWMLGGDASVNESQIEADPRRQALRDMNTAMAEGITDAVNAEIAQDGFANYASTFMTLHPQPGSGATARSSKNLPDYQNAPWMDFDTIQSAITHDRLTGNASQSTFFSVMNDYELTGPGDVLRRPTADLEVSYEHSWRRFFAPEGNDRIPITTWEARRSGYLSVFAGGHGVTYGHRNLIQFLRAGQSAVHGANAPWFDSLGVDLSSGDTLSGADRGEAANHIQYLRRLILSRPFFDRIPDQGLLAEDAGNRFNRLQATRASDGGYAFIYSANGRDIEVNVAVLGDTEINAWWYNPRDGATYDSAGTNTSGLPFIACGSLAADQVTFDPPGDPSPTSDQPTASELIDNTIGNDWVLVIDRANRGFSVPGDQGGAPLVTCPATENFQQDAGGDHLLVVEAENADLSIPRSGKEWLDLADSVGASGDAALRALPNTGTNFGVLSTATSSSPRLDFRVSFAAAGTHYVWVRARATNRGEDSVHVGLNEGDSSVGEGGMRFARDGEWAWGSEVSNANRATVTVASPGTHILNVWMREDGFSIDKILLTTNPNFVPADLGPPESTRTAEPDILEPANQPPILADIADQTNSESDSVGLVASATDPDNDDVAYAAVDLPPGLSIDASSGIITGTVIEAGTFLSTVSASDSRGGSASVFFEWVVVPLEEPGDLFFQQAGGDDELLVVEAEHHDDNSPRGLHHWANIDSPTGLSGASAMQALPELQRINRRIGTALTSSPRLDFSVNFTSVGTHYVWLRGNGANSGEDSVHVGLIGGDVNVSNTGMRFRRGGVWEWSDRIANGQRATLEISRPGPQTLSIWMREDGYRLDKLLLTTNPDFVPFNAGPAESIRSQSSSSGSAGSSNGVPSVVDPGNQTGVVGDSVNWVIEASDPDDDALTFSASNLPAGVWIDAATGVIGGTFELAGTFNPTVSVSDLEGATASVSFTATVSELGGLVFQQSPAPGNLLVIEAENADGIIAQGAHTWSLGAAAAASDGNFAEATPNVGTNQSADYVANSPRLDFAVNFVASGLHYVWVRGFASNSGADSVHVGLDEIDVDSGRRVDHFTLNVWDWSGLIRVPGSESRRATLDVPAPGLHSLNVWMREDGFRIDKILVTTDSEFSPSGEGPAQSPR